MPSTREKKRTRRKKKKNNSASAHPMASHKTKPFHPRTFLGQSYKNNPTQTQSLSTNPVGFSLASMDSKNFQIYPTAPAYASSIQYKNG
jgi:hypothetical protein